jgi:hypothetical protein
MPKQIKSDWHHTFIKELRATGSVKMASVAAGVTSAHAFTHRKKVPAFATQWDEALRSARAAAPPLPWMNPLFEELKKTGNIRESVVKVGTTPQTVIKYMNRDADFRKAVWDSVEACPMEARWAKWCLPWLERLTGGDDPADAADAVGMRPSAVRAYVRKHPELRDKRDAILKGREKEERSTSAREIEQMQTMARKLGMVLAAETPTTTPALALPAAPTPAAPSRNLMDVIKAYHEHRSNNPGSRVTRATKPESFKATADTNQTEILKLLGAGLDESPARPTPVELLAASQRYGGDVSTRTQKGSVHAYLSENRLKKLFELAQWDDTADALFGAIEKLAQTKGMEISTVNEYKGVVRGYCRFRTEERLRQLAPDVIGALIQKGLGRLKILGKSDGSCDRCIAAIKSLGRWGAKTGHFQGDPASQIQYNGKSGVKVSRSDQFSENLFRRMVEQARKSSTLVGGVSGREWADYFETAAAFGFTPSEGHKLTPDHFAFVNGSLYADINGRKSPCIPALEASKIRANLRDKDPRLPVFPGIIKTIKGRAYCSVGSAIGVYAREAGLLLDEKASNDSHQRYDAKSIRMLWCRLATEDGATKDQIQAWLGRSPDDTLKLLKEALTPQLLGRVLERSPANHLGQPRADQPLIEVGKNESNPLGGSDRAGEGRRVQPSRRPKKRGPSVNLKKAAKYLPIVRERRKHPTKSVKEFAELLREREGAAIEKQTAFYSLIRDALKWWGTNTKRKGKEWEKDIEDSLKMVATV